MLPSTLGGGGEEEEEGSNSRVFVLDFFSYQGWRAQSTLLFTHNWGRRDGYMPNVKWNLNTICSSRIWIL